MSGVNHSQVVWRVESRVEYCVTIFITIFKIDLKRLWESTLINIDNNKIC